MQNIEEAIEMSRLKFVLRLLAHEYTSEFIKNLVENVAKKHQLSLFADCINLTEKIEEIKNRIAILYEKNRADKTQTIESTRLRVLLQNPIRNQEQIFKMLQIF